MRKDTSEPAFPRNGHPDKNDFPIDGMSLRDYFAAKALQGLLSYTYAADRFRGDLKVAAIEAYEIADAMLEERKK